MTGVARGAEAVTGFLAGYLAMPPDADVEITSGYLANSAWPDAHLLRVRITHHKHRAVGMILTADDARAVADIAESTLHRWPRLRGLENLIMGLRAAADKLEAGA